MGEPRAHFPVNLEDQTGDSETRLDNRARILADLIEHRIVIAAEAMRPAGAARPFTEQMTNADALDWWRRNRYTPIGQKALVGYKPDEVMALDAWLARNPDQTVLGQGLVGP